MKTKFKIDNVVYAVNQFRIAKGVVKKIKIEKTKNNTSVVYEVQDVKNNKVHECVEAQLADTLNTAKQSAIRNWITIDYDVRKQLEEMTEDAFNPIVKEKVKNDK